VRCGANRRASDDTCRCVLNSLARARGAKVNTNIIAR